MPAVALGAGRRGWIRLRGPPTTASDAHDTTVPVVADDVLALLHSIADECGAAFRQTADRRPSGVRDGQYAFDLTADGAAMEMIRGAGLSALTEEFGYERGRSERCVVVDPIDGSTNASRGIPWFATAACVVDDGAVTAAVVANHAAGTRWWAVRGSGAFADGLRIAPSGCDRLADAIVALNGLPGGPPAWRQTRILGAAALDLCLVAGGSLDGYLDCAVEAHGVWDYLASSLICAEAGAVVVDALGRDLVVLDPAARRTPVAASTARLAAELVEHRRRYAGGSPGA
jgi:fructose-1,6-bisphosphatase/inositol monophosphatase family enzyme